MYEVAKERADRKKEIDQIIKSAAATRRVEMK
jgi:hypothetical protein